MLSCSIAEDEYPHDMLLSLLIWEIVGAFLIYANPSRMYDFCNRYSLRWFEKAWKNARKIRVAINNFISQTFFGTRYWQLLLLPQTLFFFPCSLFFLFL